MPDVEDAPGPRASPEGELARLGPVARMMMSVASHAITSYVQFRALAEVLIARGAITREELEAQFSLMRDHELDRTIDEWFPADIAVHLKVAVQSAMAEDAAESARPGEPGGVAPPEMDEVARARAMQDHRPASNGG